MNIEMTILKTICTDDNNDPKRYQFKYNKSDNSNIHIFLIFREEERVFGIFHNELILSHVFRKSCIILFYIICRYQLYLGVP